MRRNWLSMTFRHDESKIGHDTSGGNVRLRAQEAS
jgi:hypothetical protein